MIMQTTRLTSVYGHIYIYISTINIYIYIYIYLYLPSVLFTSIYSRLFIAQYPSGLNTLGGCTIVFWLHSCSSELH